MEDVRLAVGGLKCDACDFKDMSIKYEEFHEWVGKSCPKCGENLLTKADFEAVVKLVSNFEAVYSLTELTPDDFVVDLEMDGSGDIKLNMKE